MGTNKSLLISDGAKIQESLSDAKPSDAASQGKYQH